MVHTLPVKKTTLVTMDMSKSTCPKWQCGLLMLVQIGYFFTTFASQKIPCFLVVVVECKEGKKIKQWF
jgi:hypothetical protein